MDLHPIKLGGIETRNNVFLAPLAGYTNYPFRRLCASYGAGLTYTEMVSAKGLKYGSENTKELLLTGEDEFPRAVQLFGNDPDILRWACESKELEAYPIVDLNMGCPVPKIYKNGEGSALLADPVLAEKIVTACVKSGKIITVKFRVGLKEGQFVTEEFARRVVGAGASLITVHGRARDQFYSGTVYTEEIAKAKNAVSVPVIANGGVFSVSDGEELLKKTGADGVMIARAAMNDPQIFCDFTGKQRESKKEMLLRQLNDTERYFDGRFTTVYMRKMAAFYLKGERGSAAHKARLFSAAAEQELRGLIEEIFE